MTSNKPVVGLIGGMGSGKSLVASLFAQHGARVLAGDVFGHEALRQPHVREQVIARWGRGVLDENGEINRRKLGALVFADPAQRRALEALSCPWIERRFRDELEKAGADPAVSLVVIDAAILLEAGWHNFCDRIVYVHAPRPVRLRRLSDGRGWTQKEVAAREQAQWPLAVKAGRADDAIDNSGPPEETARQVEALLRRWGIGAGPQGLPPGDEERIGR